MTVLEARKQLLIAESGIQRALLARDGEEMAGAARNLIREGKKAARVAASGALLFGAGMALGRGRKEGAPSRHPWLRRILGLGLRSLPWWIEYFEARRHGQTGNGHAPAESNPAAARP